MSDIQTMQNMITGLRSKRKSLLADEAVFLKLSGINEEIEKANQDKTKYETGLEGAKERRDDLKKKKGDAVAETTSKIAEKMNVVLPGGSSVFTYAEDDDGKRDLKIGWREGVETDTGDGVYEVDSTTTPYNGLSGMQKQVFDAALAHVLDANIIVLEAAELDADNLEKSLLELSKIDKQVIVNTCHPIGMAIPGTFKIIEV